MIAKEKSRHDFIDLLRIIAAFLVIVNHTNSEIFLNRGISFTWFLSLGYFFVSKIAVPIFVMITGYLMIGRIETYIKHVKRIIRMILVLIIFSLPYYVDNIGIESFDIIHYFKTIIGSSVTTAYWYIYFYIGVLIMLPFLQRFFNALEKKDILIFCILSGVFNMLWPILVHYFPSLQLFGSFQVPILGAYIALLFIGGYFRKYGVPKINSIWYILIFIMSLSFNIIMTYIEYQKNAGWYLFLDNREYLPIVLQSICVFAIFSRVQINERIASVIKMIGGCTFGVYLLSDLFIKKLRFIYEGVCATGVHELFAVVLFEIIVFAVGFAITFILKQIPYLKKIV